MTKEKMMDDWTKTVLEEQTTLTSDTALMKTKHEKSHKKTELFCKHLAELGTKEQKYSRGISDALTNLANRMSDTEMQRAELIARLDKELKERLGKLSEDMKLQQQRIRSRNTLADTYRRNLDQLSRQREARTPDNTRLASLQETYQRSANAMRETEQDLNKNLGDFEQRRFTEMRAYLANYVRAHIAFYARAIENLSTAYGFITRVDSNVEAMGLQEKLVAHQPRELQDEKKAPGT